MRNFLASFAVIFYSKQAQVAGMFVPPSAPSASPLLLCSCLLAARAQASSFVSFACYTDRFSEQRHPASGFRVPAPQASTATGNLVLWEEKGCMILPRLGFTLASMFEHGASS